MRYGEVTMYERVETGWNGQVGKGRGREEMRVGTRERSLFASDVDTLFLLVEIGFRSALFSVWLQFGGILKWHCIGSCLPRAVSPPRFLAVKRGRGHEVEAEVHFPLVAASPGSGPAPGLRPQGRANNKAFSSSCQNFFFHGMSRGWKLLRQGRAVGKNGGDLATVLPRRTWWICPER
jgi:hypothetical protein